MMVIFLGMLDEEAYSAAILTLQTNHSVTVDVLEVAERMEKKTIAMAPVFRSERDAPGGDGGTNKLYLLLSKSNPDAVIVGNEEVVVRRRSRYPVVSMCYVLYC